MAHELEFKNGQASFFTVKQSAWHKEGTVLDTAPSLDEAFALANLNYTVDKRTVQYECKTPDGDTYYKPSTTAFVTVRTDTEEELGSVGSTYVPVQNADAFRVLEPLLDTGVATLETGGVIRDGADAWLMVKWDLSKFSATVQEVFGTELIPYGLLANNHNGRRGILLQDTNIRVVCANTLGFAERSSERRLMVKHSSQGMEKLIEAAQSLWNGIISRYDVLAEQYQILQSTMLTEEQFTAAVLDTVAPDPRVNPKFNPEGWRAEMVVERAQRKRAELRRLWTEGKGHTGEPTAWYAYNGTVEALDHNSTLFPTRAGTWRTSSLLDGTLKQLKDTVLTNCLALASA